MNYLILGASGGLGRALSYRFAAAGHDLAISSSDERDLSAMASDLKLRFGGRIVQVPADLSAGDCEVEDILVAASALGSVDGLLFPLGAVSDDDGGSLEPRTTSMLVHVNFLAVVDAVSAWLRRSNAKGRGVIVGFGSIASARGRGANAVYSAAKRALESYFESLRHAFAEEGPLVQFYVLGYLDTSLAFGRTKLFPKASPERLADRVLANLDRDIGVVYFPGFWRWVRWLLRLLPWFVYRRMRF